MLELFGLILGGTAIGALTVALGLMWANTHHKPAPDETKDLTQDDFRTSIERWGDLRNGGLK